MIICVLNFLFFLCLGFFVNSYASDDESLSLFRDLELIKEIDMELLDELPLQKSGSCLVCRYRESLLAFEVFENTT